MNRHSFDGVIRRPAAPIRGTRSILHPQEKPCPEVKVLPLTSSQPSSIKKRFWSVRRLTLFIVIGAIIAIVIWYGWAWWAGVSLFTPSGQSPFGQLQSLFSKNELRGESEDRVDIVLAGIGGDGHDGEELTDTIQIISIRPSDGKTTMISLPRDFYVFDPLNDEYTKINKLNPRGMQSVGTAEGGMENLIQAIETALGEDIEYYVKLDFAGFKDVIDYLGGVDINVDHSFVDSEYPDENYGYQTIEFEKGMQRMDGETALQYTRSRHGQVTDGSGAYEGSDFARSRRQQKILIAIKNAILKTETLVNPQKMQKVFSSLDQHILTTLTLDDALRLYELTRNSALDKIDTYVISTDNLLAVIPSIDGAYLVGPRRGQGDYTEIQLYADAIFEDDPLAAVTSATLSTVPAPATPEAESKTIEVTAPADDNATIEIRNGSGVTGLAQRVSIALKNEGYNVKEIGNADRYTYEETLIYPVNDGHDATTERLENYFQVSSARGTPALTSEQDFLIVLGADYANYAAE